jgi:hypothetical protein
LRLEQFFDFFRQKRRKSAHTLCFEDAIILFMATQNKHFDIHTFYAFCDFLYIHKSSIVLLKRHCVATTVPFSFRLKKFGCLSISR